MPDTDNGRPSGAGASQIEVAFARFEGTVSAELKNVAHDVKNLVAALAAYATTRDLNAAEARISKLEKDQTWLVRTFIGAVVTIVVTGLGLLLKGSHP